jgi:hypothetical protein
LTELEQQLHALARDVDWPPTPSLAPWLGGRRNRRPLVLAVALLLVALGIAFAVPPARSAILRFFHLGGVTIERVGVLPPARERPLAASLGQPVSEAEAATILGGPFRVPPVTGRPRLYAQGGVVSILLATPQPVLLSELRSDGPYLVKKVLGGATSVESLELAPGVPAFWLTGKRHVLIVFGTPPRLAGNVLVWAQGALTYRVEGPRLDRAEALRLAGELDGT